MARSTGSRLGSPGPAREDPVPARLALFVALSVAAFTACDQAPFGPDLPDLAGGHGGAPPTLRAPPPDPLALRFPTAGKLFDDAIRPSCAEGTACHGGRAFPRLATFADLQDTFGAPCQRTVADARAVVDACEIRGDFLVFGATTRRILGLRIAEGEPSPPGSAEILLDGPAGPDPVSLRRSPRGMDNLPDEALPAGALTVLAETQVRLSLLGLPEGDRAAWDERVYPRKDTDVIVWDPNGNGIAGAALGVKLAVRGDARRSYLFLRLLSDDLGSRMPLVPGTWSPEATRALGCFLRSPVGADEPLVLADCPPDPSLPGTSKVSSILQSQCAFAGCHDPKERASGLDLTPNEALPLRLRGMHAGQRPELLLADVGNPGASYLVCKVDPACADRKGDVMPRGLLALSDSERETLRAWIAADLPSP